MPFDAQHSHLSRRRGTERRARQHAVDRHREGPSPSVCTVMLVARPALGRVPRHDDVGRNELTAGREKPAHQRSADAERGVGHDMERAPREAKVGGIGLHDRDRGTREPLAKMLRAARMQLDGDDSRASRDQSGRERAGPGADVDDEITRSDGGLLDEQPRPVVSELMPAPPRPLVRGHDAP